MARRQFVSRIGTGRRAGKDASARLIDTGEDPVSRAARKLWMKLDPEIWGRTKRPKKEK